MHLFSIVTPFLKFGFVALFHQTLVIRLFLQAGTEAELICSSPPLPGA